MDAMQGQDPVQDHIHVMQGPDLGQGHLEGHLYVLSGVKIL